MGAGREGVGQCQLPMLDLSAFLLRVRDLLCLCVTVKRLARGGAGLLMCSNDETAPKFLSCFLCLFWLSMCTASLSLYALQVVVVCTLEGGGWCDDYSLENSHVKY